MGFVSYGSPHGIRVACREVRASEAAEGLQSTPGGRRPRVPHTPREPPPRRHLLRERRAGAAAVETTSSEMSGPAGSSILLRNFFRSVHTNFKCVGPPGVTVKCADFIILALVCPMIVRGGGEQKKHPKTKKIEFSSGGGVV